MAHRYRQPVEVQRAPGNAPGASAPAAFLWRGAWYQVDATLATWRLRDRWWVAPAADVLGEMDGAADVMGGMVADAQGPTERVYYRVRCVDPEGEQIFDLYHDDARDLWVLDRAHD